MRLILAVLASLWVPGACGSAEARQIGRPWARTLTDVDGRLEQLRLLVPFYEGIEIARPVASLPEAGLGQFELAYPGALSAPFVAWTYGEGRWTIAYVDRLDALPVALDVKTNSAGLELSLRPYTPCMVRTMEVRGDWGQLAKALRAVWDVRPCRPPLAKRFKRINFYVHQWVSPDQAPHLRHDWTVDQLVEHMRHEVADTVQFVYGYDLAGCDLGGRYLWAEDAERKAKLVIAANQGLAHLSWLNLRTYKTWIPALRLGAPLSGGDRRWARVYSTGVHTGSGVFTSVDMCLASEGWQKSRIEQLDRLAGVGFKVVQLDEFPIPAFWHVNPCLAKDHLHKPGDAADEWRQTLKFIAALAKRADERGVTLTCEGPSAALLPYVSGYIDRQFNDSIDVYAPWKKSQSIHPVPFFGAMFGNICTPYTDADDVEPAREPPARWLKQHKVWPK